MRTHIYIVIYLNFEFIIFKIRLVKLYFRFIHISYIHKGHKYFESKIIFKESTKSLQRILCKYRITVYHCDFQYVARRFCILK